MMYEQCVVTSQHSGCKLSNNITHMFTVDEGNTLPTNFWPCNWLIQNLVVLLVGLN